MFDLRNFVTNVETTLSSHNLGQPGAYRRWNSQAEGKETRDLGLNHYGVADAANLLYTIGHFPGDGVERQSWIRTLQALQTPETGLFEEPTHHPMHCTAYCIAALELFNARPSHPLTAYAPLRKPHALTAFLDTLNWRGTPWQDSHKGAGIYAALVLNGESTHEWEDRYFSWLWEETDPQTGLLRKGRIAPVEYGGITSFFPHLAGTFRYLLNMEWARRPIRYPEKLVDTCLEIFSSGDYPIGQQFSFAEFYWVFTLNRAYRQSNGHRAASVRDALIDFENRYLPFLLDIDPETDDNFNDLHMLFGALLCLSELQQALPGTIRTQRPLRPVHDRRPFI